MSVPFRNKTGTTKFTGEFNVGGVAYEYTLYLLPDGTHISPMQKREIVHSFGNRVFKGEICLGVDMNTIRGYINDRNVSAFVRVKPIGIDNEASGTLQIFKHCENSEPDIWINDVCRIGSERQGNPVYALFVFMEQLSVQNMNRKNVKLYVERDPENLAFLKNKYETLGFTRNADDHPDVCPAWEHDELVMEKTGLVPRPDIIDFSFLDDEPSIKRRRLVGGKRETKRECKKGKKHCKDVRRKTRKTKMRR